MAIELAFSKVAVTGDSTIDFTSSELSAAPKAVLCAFGAGQTDGVAASGWQRSIGATDGASEFLETAGIQDGTSSTSVERKMEPATALRDPSIGSNDDRLEHNSFLSNGWRADHTLNGDPNGHQALAAMFGGSDVTVEVGAFTLSNGTITKTLNNTSLTPNVIIFFCGGDDTGTRSTFFTPSFGIAYDNGSSVINRRWAMGEDNNSGTATPRQNLSTSGVIRQDTSGAWHASCDRMATGEFDLTVFNNPGGDQAFYIALQLDNANISLTDITTPTTTGVHEETGPGFQPKGVIQVLTMMTAYGTADDATAGSFALSVFNGTEEACLSWAHEDGVTTMNTQSMCHSRAVYYAADNGTLAFDGTFSQFTSNGWEIDYSTVDGTARKGFALAIGEVTSGVSATVGLAEETTTAFSAALPKTVQTGLSSETDTAFALVDTRAPVLTNASATETGSYTAEGSVDTDEGTGILYWVVTQSSTKPSVSQVQSGQNHIGDPAADSSAQGSFDAGTITVTADGLSELTEYWFHFQHEDGAGNNSDVVTSNSITTPEDVTAPALTNASASLDTTSTADGTVTTDEANGTLYHVVTDSSTAPTAAQVKAGEDHTGASAANSGSRSISSTGEKQVGSGGNLTSGTTYWFHFMHEDIASNQSDVVTSNSFTVGVKSVSLATETTTSFSVTSDQQGQVQVGLAGETDASFTVDSAKTRSVSLAAVTESAQTVQAARTKAVSQVIERNIALSPDYAKSQSVGLSTSSETAFDVTGSTVGETVISVGLSTETVTALTVASARAVSTGLSNELDSALTVTRSKEATVGQATSSEVALGVTSSQETQVLVNQATETATAFGTTSAKAVATGLGTDTSTAFGVFISRAQDVGLSAETDSAFSVTSSKQTQEQIGLATETATAFGTASAKVRAVGLVVETTVALATTTAKTALVGRSDSAETAQGVSIERGVALGFALESAVSQAVTAGKALAAAQAQESDTAFILQLTDPRMASLGHTTVGIVSDGGNRATIGGSGNKVTMGRNGNKVEKA